MLHLGVLCIRKFHLGKHIVSNMVNSILGQVFANEILDDMPYFVKVSNMGIPVLKD